MPRIKVTISLEESLFKQVDALARELQISRSQLFTLAVAEFIQQRQNQAILEALNAAYDHLPDPEEQEYRQAVRRQHQKLVEGQ
ncbi:MAG: ribbon-helix-helix domain-containing protein [Chloroflexi bacterium]|nr:ribbon-helix-helix domain-containing protein [Chloroflexota bacterium]MCI0577718.1 ribbon-helix-helix domain-containing protein [Chloroflexota bacterium]MCI0649801.1 ribbon-helix-helix domain-containing protein [Chloroflexota bacterium]MCI0730510.1 ribbon-helix-helix domain-containing protein [Chloroflexota bacterium]